ncbi:MAG: hypothetical protein U0804_28680 [Gemmataceae bacterium]
MILTLPRLTAPTGRVADGVGRYLDRLARRQRIAFRDIDPRWLRQQRRKLRLDGSLDIPRLAVEARARGLAAMYGELYGRIIHRDGSVTNLGLLGRRVITDAGVAYIAADIGGGASDSNLFKYHGFGTGSTAESASQTALVTELTTQYATDNTRPTGSQANSTNTYTTVATLSPDATVTITEHGIFTATSAGTMLDRTVFTGVALTGSADSLQATYVLTLPSGG